MMPVPIVAAIPLLALPAVAIYEALRPRIQAMTGDGGGSGGTALAGGSGGSGGVSGTPGPSEQAASEAVEAVEGPVTVPAPADRLRDVVANLPDEATSAIGAITAALDRRASGNPIPEGPRELDTIEVDTAPDPVEDRPIPDAARREPGDAGQRSAPVVDQIRAAIARRFGGR